MKATLVWFAALFLAVTACSLAQADPYPYYPGYTPQAPDACGPGFYCTNYCGQAYGPNYCLQPGWPPFNGFRPCLSSQNGNGNGNGAGGAAFRMHPFAHGPRDFFMVDDGR
ncbi:MAG TPA: hypothetical protein VGY66_11705 [Gemmataceae bacterium]|jgi:hypothetical protein|nr:hypothetical protein [Gemmataceae bacterium]